VVIGTWDLYIDSGCGEVYENRVRFLVRILVHSFLIANASVVLALVLVYAEDVQWRMTR
jgi:hypothetical protein